MGLISWILFGALAGWVASIFMGTNKRQGCLLNIVVGVIGALIGGFLIQLLTSGSVDWADPFIGARLQHQLAPSQEITLRGDVGGFGAGSQFSWQAMKHIDKVRRAVSWQ